MLIHYRSTMWRMHFDLKTHSNTLFNIVQVVRVPTSLSNFNDYPWGLKEESNFQIAYMNGALGKSTE